MINFGFMLTDLANLARKHGKEHVLSVAKADIESYDNFDDETEDERRAIKADVLIRFEAHLELALNVERKRAEGGILFSRGQSGGVGLRMVRK